MPSYIKAVTDDLHSLERQIADRMPGICEFVLDESGSTVLLPDNTTVETYTGYGPLVSVLHITDMDLLSMELEGFVHCPRAKMELKFSAGIGYTDKNITVLDADMDDLREPVYFRFDLQRGLRAACKCHGKYSTRKQAGVLNRMKDALLSDAAASMLKSYTDRTDYDDRTWSDMMDAVNAAAKRKPAAFDPEQWLRAEASVPQDVLDMVYERYTTAEKVGCDGAAFGLYYQKAPRKGVLVSVVGVDEWNVKDHVSDMPETASVREHWYLTYGKKVRFLCGNGQMITSSRRWFAGMPALSRHLFVQSIDEVGDVLCGTSLDGIGLIEYWKSSKTRDWLGSEGPESPLIGYGRSRKHIAELLRDEGRFRFLESVCGLSNICGCLSYRSRHQSPVDIPYGVSGRLDELMGMDGISRQTACRLAEYLYPDMEPGDRYLTLTLYALHCAERAFQMEADSLIDYIAEQARVCGIRFSEALEYLSPAAHLAEMAREANESAWIPGLFEKAMLSEGLLSARQRQLDALYDLNLNGYTVAQAQSKWDVICSAWATDSVQTAAGTAHNSVYTPAWIIARDADAVPCAMAFLCEEGIFMPRWNSEGALEALKMYAVRNELPFHEDEDDFVSVLIDYEAGLPCYTCKMLERTAIRRGCHNKYMALDEMVLKKRVYRELLNGRQRDDVGSDLSLLDE